MNKIAAIIQARMGSSRLPKKVLAKIEGKPMLWHQVNRLKQSKFSPEIIIATSNLEQDKPILDLANQLNVKSYAGSHEDVLDRYYQASLINKIDIIVRITADCPLLDSEVFDKVLNTFLEGDYDYVSNVRPATYPDGLDVEVFSFVTLKKTWNNARLSSEREHVTGYIATHLNEFKNLNVTNSVDLSDLRWTVDEKEDLEFVRSIYKNLYHKNPNFLMKDILDLLKGKPELIEINKGFIRNDGYLKSLQNDKIIK